MRVPWKAPHGVALEPRSEGGREVGGADEPGSEDVEPREGVWPPWAGRPSGFVLRTLHTHGPVPAPLRTGAPALGPHRSLGPAREHLHGSRCRFLASWQVEWVLGGHSVLHGPQSRPSGPHLSAGKPTRAA